MRLMRLMGTAMESKNVILHWFTVFRPSILRAFAALVMPTASTTMLPWGNVMRSRRLKIRRLKIRQGGVCREWWMGWTKAENMGRPAAALPL